MCRSAYRVKRMLCTFRSKVSSGGGSGQISYVFGGPPCIAVNVVRWKTNKLRQFAVLMSICTRKRV